MARLVTITAGVFQILKPAILLVAIAVILLVNWWVTRVFFAAASHRQPFLLFLFYLLSTLFVVLVVPFFSLGYLMAWLFASRPVHPAVVLLMFSLWIWPTVGIMLWNSRRHKNPYYPNEKRRGKKGSN